jgi:hypothetical protein
MSHQGHARQNEGGSAVAENLEVPNDAGGVAAAVAGRPNKAGSPAGQPRRGANLSSTGVFVVRCA